MPRKSDSVAIKNKSLDRRFKLTDEERIEIADTYKSGGTSYNKLAVEYGVSKRLIMFIVNPDKYEVAKNQFSERQKGGRYYDREKHNKAVREHRDYKKELFKEGRNRIMAGIKISVDDIRAIPDGYDLLFLNPENFISWRKDNPEITISELSLDHDMGLDYMGGYDLVKYMVDDESMNINKIEYIQFHTDNMIGLKNMYCYLESAKKHGAIWKEIIVEKEKINLIDGKLSYSGYSFGG